MSDDMLLFDFTEGQVYKADPVMRRRTVVREHSRVLPPGATPRVEPTARKSDPPASHQAARIAAPTADNWRGKALLLLYSDGPMTAFEMAARTGKPQTSVGVRMSELKKLGLAELTGEMRPTPNGGDAAVYRLTDEGVVKAKELRG